MNTISEKYRNLYDACHKYPRIQLATNKKAYISETNPEYVANKYAEDGFIEKFGLIDEDKEKTKTYRMKKKH